MIKLNAVVSVILRFITSQEVIDKERDVLIAILSWSKTFNSWYAMYSTSKSSLSSGTYRLKTVARVYSGNSYETITIYSSSASC